VEIYRDFRDLMSLYPVTKRLYRLNNRQISVPFT